MPELYLVVQNVSKAPIRLSDTTPAPRRRYLKLNRDGETLFGIVINDPTGTDKMLHPRELAYLLMFMSDAKDVNGRTEGSGIAEGVLRNALETLVAEMKIEHAPAGAWTGKLVTGETTGAMALGGPQPKDKTAKSLLSCGSTMRGEMEIPRRSHRRSWRQSQGIPPLEQRRVRMPKKLETLMCAVRRLTRLDSGGGRVTAGRHHCDCPKSARGSNG